MVALHAASRDQPCRIGAVWPRLVVLLALAWCSVAAAAQQSLVLSGSTGHYPAAHVLRALEDPQHRLQIDEVVQASTTARFRPALPPGSTSEVYLGYSRSAWWLALPLQSDAAAPRQWLLEVGYPSLDQVEVYTPRADGGYDRQMAGDLQPFSARPYPHRNLVFPLTLTPGQSQTVYLRVVSEGNLTLPVTLWQPDALASEDRIDYTVLSLYYGMLLALGLYNLLLFMATRDVNFLAYVAFTMAMAVGQASMNGLGNQFIWPEWPEWGNVALPIGMAATGFFGAIFTRIFLGTRNVSALLDRCIVVLIALFALIAMSPLLLSYRSVAIIVSVAGMVFSFTAVIVGVYCLRRGNPGARYFLLAWSMLLIGAAVLAMRNLGWLPTTWLTMNAMQIGSALELLLLSFALADRINTMRRDKDRANDAALAAKQLMVEALRKSEQELERRVAERTQDLESANNSLREKERELEHLARHDPLTGLSNRLFLNDRIERAIARARRNSESVALLLVDLDDFKQVNDAHGHAAGDELLVAIARRVSESVRQSDTVARLGGDEFVILLEDVRAPEELGNIVEKLIAAVRQPTLLASGATVTISVSIGVACAPQHAETAERLLERADIEMYKAKASGRNRWSIATQEWSARRDTAA